MEEAGGRLRRHGTYGITQASRTADVTDEDGIALLVDELRGAPLPRAGGMVQDLYLRAAFERHHLDPVYVELAVGLYQELQSRSVAASDVLAEDGLPLGTVARMQRVGLEWQVSGTMASSVTGTRASGGRPWSGRGFDQTYLVPGQIFLDAGSATRTPLGTALRRLGRCPDDERAVQPILAGVPELKPSATAAASRTGRRCDAGDQVAALPGVRPTAVPAAATASVLVALYSETALRSAPRPKSSPPAACCSTLRGEALALRLLDNRATPARTPMPCGATLTPGEVPTRPVEPG